MTEIKLKSKRHWIIKIAHLSKRTRKWMKILPPKSKNTLASAHLQSVPYFQQRRWIEASYELIRENSSRNGSTACDVWKIQWFKPTNEGLQLISKRSCAWWPWLHEEDTLSGKGKWVQKSIVALLPKLSLENYKIHSYNCYWLLQKPV